MTFQEITSEEIPTSIRALQENVAIYQAAKRLLILGPSRAMKIKLEGVSSRMVCKKAHVFFRHRPQKLRTRVKGGYIYLWLEHKDPSRFEVTAVPTAKAAKSA